VIRLDHRFVPLVHLVQSQHRPDQFLCLTVYNVLLENFLHPEQFVLLAQLVQLVKYKHFDFDLFFFFCFILDLLLKAGAISCTFCGEGQIANAAATGCTNCSAGTYAPFGATRCFNCGRIFFVCFCFEFFFILIGPGSFSADLATACSFCSPGLFSSDSTGKPGSCE
jgi:hypothetical protein